MEFKSVGKGMYFPPTIPNGDVIGYAPGATDKKVCLMSVTDEGIQLAGVTIEWHSITGVSEGIANKGATIVIHSNKYSSPNFVFYQTGMELLRSEYDDPERMHRGYPIAYALMNRITLELQQYEKAINVF